LTVIKIAIVPGNAKIVISAKWATHDLTGKITCILGALEPGDKAKKILNACNHFGVDRGLAYMIGDSVSDIRYAKRARVQSIAVTWGWQSRDRIVKEDPDFILGQSEFGMIASTLVAMSERFYRTIILIDGPVFLEVFKELILFDIKRSYLFEF